MSAIYAFYFRYILLNSFMDMILRIILYKGQNAKCNTALQYQVGVIHGISKRMSISEDKLDLLFRAKIENAIKHAQISMIENENIERKAVFMQRNQSCQIHARRPVRNGHQIFRGLLLIFHVIQYLHSIQENNATIVSRISSLGGLFFSIFLFSILLQDFK